MPTQPADKTAAQTIKDVPFYANREDGLSCMLAVYRMVLKYFLHKELSWDELETLTGYKPSRAAWSVQALTEIANNYHLSVRMIEPFNYKRFASEGKDYLYDLYDNEEVDWQLEHTNVLDMNQYITKFLATVRPECRRATLQDIDDMLDEGRLVLVTLNGRALDGQDGFAKRAILVIDREGDNYVAHDPGLPPNPNRRIPRDRLWAAMGGDSNTAEVTGFMLRKAGLRLDQYVIQQKPTLSRSFAVRLIDEAKVLVNGKPNKAGYKVRTADRITIDFDESQQLKLPEIDLPVLYEDDNCVVINKPAGVLTHSKGNYNDEGTVASWLRARVNKAFLDKTGPHPSVNRAGIVHRLDRATSGVMICAKNPATLAWLQKQFHDRQAKKSYAAIVTGQLSISEAIIDMPIERNPKAPATFRVGPNGKPAVTRYHVERTSPHYSLLELQPRTGRTHQLRVHLAEQKHPIVGDKLYQGQAADRLYLHAHQLTIALPDGTEQTFTAPLPDSFAQFMQQDA